MVILFGVGVEILENTETKGIIIVLKTINNFINKKKGTIMLQFLNGKKTYITAILFGIFNVGVALGYWTPDNTIILTVNSLLATFGFSFLRLGVANSNTNSTTSK